MHLSFALTLVLTSISQVRADEPDAEARRHGWLLSWDEGLQQARQTGKPLLVVLRCAP